MYKIVNIQTGHIFELPDVKAKDLKENFPDDYEIIEKNGKKVGVNRAVNMKKQVKTSKKIDKQSPDSIFTKVVEESN